MRGKFKNKTRVFHRQKGKWGTVIESDGNKVLLDDGQVLLAGECLYSVAEDAYCKYLNIEDNHVSK
jgi:hypothetical protein